MHNLNVLRTRTCLWLATLCILPRHVHPDSVDLTDTTQLCPYSTFCTTEPRKEITNDIMMPCCTQCFCSEFCWARNDCCFDAPTPPSTGIAELQGAVECVPDSLKFVNGHRVPIHTNETAYIWMVSKCVGHGEHSEYSERCTLNQDSSFTDLIPVWSPTTRDLYRNRFCALCYDVTDYQFLSADIGELNGYLEVKEETSLAAIDYLLRNPATSHTLTVYVGNKTNIQIQYCNLSVVSECRNDTQSLKHGDLIARMCGQRIHPFYYVDKENDTSIYMWLQNIYCLLCNIDYQPYNETHGAEPNVPGQCLIPPGTRSASNAVPTFLELVSFQEPTSHSRQTCGQTEILDIYMKKCRPLLCPELSLPYNGTCYYVQDYSTRRMVSYSVTASTAWYPSANVTAHMLLCRTFVLASLELKLPICSLELGVNANQSSPDSPSRDYILYIGFQSQSSDVRNVRNIHAFLSSDLRLGYNITAVLLNGIDARQFQYEYWISESCSGDFQIIQKWCPTIELSDADFRYCITKNILPADYEFNKPAVAANQSAGRQICVQDYLHAWVGSVTSGTSKLRKCPSLLVMFLILYMTI